MVAIPERAGAAQISSHQVWQAAAKSPAAAARALPNRGDMSVADVRMRHHAARAGY